MTRLTLFCTTALGLAALPAAAEQINFSTYIPASEIAVTKGFVPLFERVAAETSGALTAQILTAGQMFGPLDTLPGIQNGAVAGGTVYASFYGKELPRAAFLHDTVALNTDRVATVGAALQTYFLDCPGCQEEAHAAGIVSLGGHALAPYMTICAKEVKTAEDLKGLRVRGSTGTMNTAIGLMGANGVNVSFGEISQAFERGNIDCIIGNQSWMSLFGLTEIVKTTIPEPTFGMVPSVTFFSFGKDAWDGWSPEVQAALARNVPQYIADVTLGYKEADEAARQAALAAGMVEVDLGPDFAALREKLTEEERKRIVAEATDRGVGEVADLLAAYEKNYAHWTELSAGIGDDPAKFAQALWDEVYSKAKF